MYQEISIPYKQPTAAQRWNRGPDNALPDTPQGTVWDNDGKLISKETKKKIHGNLLQFYFKSHVKQREMELGIQCWEYSA